MARSTKTINRHEGTEARGHKGRTCPRAFCPGGYTLAESLIASVVLAASVVGIAGTLSASYKQNSVRGSTTTAVNLAQQLMEEIAARPVQLLDGQTDMPGWGDGQTDRRLYDTVDDYHGYTDFSSSIQVADGSTVDLGAGQGTFQRSVSVQSGAVPAGLSGPADDFLLVTVTVTTPQGQAISTAQLFTRVTIYR